MSADATRERAKQELPPDDAVGNRLCEALLENPDPALIRAVNWHGDWAEAAPSAHDYQVTLSRCGDVVGTWHVDEDGTVAVLVRASPGMNQFERVRVDGDTALSNVATVGAAAIRDLVDVYGAPRLVPLEDVHGRFEDGDSR